MDSQDTQAILLQLARQVKDAASYAVITDVVFRDQIHFGRICVWHSFSCQLYSLLPREEQIKMNTIYHQKWRTIFRRSDACNKIVLVILMLAWISI